MYLKGQEVIQAYDKADYEFCGKESPHDVVSDGPRLVLVFSSGETVGSGFKGKYQFETGKKRRVNPKWNLHLVFDVHRLIFCWLEMCRVPCTWDGSTRRLMPLYLLQYKQNEGGVQLTPIPFQLPFHDQLHLHLFPATQRTSSHSFWQF